MNPEFTVLIPCYNEQDVIAQTVDALVAAFDEKALLYEVLCVNNASTDGTEEVLQTLSAKYPRVRYVNTPKLPGYGVAVRWGLEHYAGKAVVIAMADGSETPEDIIHFFSKLEEGYDCVFGSRFSQDGSVEGYPRFKLLVNRFGNRLISWVTGSNYDDFTNGFKMYKRDVVDSMQPLFSEKFNLTIEMSIGASLLKPRIAIVGNSWRDRSLGTSKFDVVGQSRLYLMTLLYVWLKGRIQGSGWKSFREQLREGRERQIGTMPSQQTGRENG